MKKADQHGKPCLLKGGSVKWKRVTAQVD